MVARIEIELRQPIRRGKFDDIIIHLHKEEGRYSTNINFDFTPLYSFAGDKESVVFDFLLFSVLIYNIDRFVNRNIFSLEGWTREIVVDKMPVIHIDGFRNNKTRIDNAISYLTGDTWDINFTTSEGVLYHPREGVHVREDINNFEKVSLFSGGLDSLIGVINELEVMSNEKKLLLVSHKDLGKEGTDQNSIMAMFTREQWYRGRYEQVQTSVGIGKRVMGNRLPKESTFRSRSLLFLGMGIYAAHNIGKNVPLLIPENGTIVLNIPLMPSRRSACSTRTTHPTFLKQIQGILSELGIFNQVLNPYEFCTKGEMILHSRNSAILGQTIEHSCSCAKRGHTRHWDRREPGIRHCGMCLPCIYRRVALHMREIDNATLYGTDVFHGRRFDINNSKQPSSLDFRTLLDFIKRKPIIEQIEKELIINGLKEPNTIRDHAEVVDRTIEQIIEWIRDKGTNYIKRKAGIR